MSDLENARFAWARLVEPVQIELQPMPDITAYELAILLPLFLHRAGIMPSEIPTDPAVRRHLIVDGQSAK